MVNVRIIEGDYDAVDNETYLQIKQDYVSNFNITVKDICSKYSLSCKRWSEIKKQIFEETGFTRYGSRDNNINKKYYYKVRDKYCVQKRDGTVKKYFGYYETEDDVKKVVAELIKCDWDVEQVPIICDRLGITHKAIEKNDKIKNYYESNGVYAVRKRIGGVNVYFGCYKSEELAKQIVSELRKVKWDKNQLPMIRECLGV